MRNSILLSILIIVIFGCKSDDDEMKGEFVPREVTVGIKSGTDISTVFDFINLFDHNVDYINSLTFTSDLPSSDLQYILDFLNDKAYTKDKDGRWLVSVSGYLHYQTNQITIFPRLFEMHKLEYQIDWLNSMDKLKLKEKHNIELASGIIKFHVPIGTEVEWEKRFENYNIVAWAELNYIGGIGPTTN